MTKPDDLRGGEVTDEVRAAQHQAVDAIAAAVGAVRRATGKRINIALIPDSWTSEDGQLLAQRISEIIEAGPAALAAASGAERPIDEARLRADQQERFKHQANASRDEMLEHVQRAIGIIELADNRAMAADGPVSRTADELGDDEWRSLYQALIKARMAYAAYNAIPATVGTEEEK